MNGIRNVQTLFLTSSTLEVLSLFCESMPVFNNLKSLGFYSGENRWQAVPALLKNCPHLETLSILGLLHVVKDTCGDVCDCIPREDKGRSLTSCSASRRGVMHPLKVKTVVDPFRVDRWICNVVQPGVSHLELFLEFGEDYSLPYEISVSKTLVELKAGYEVDLYSWDDDISLPMLKYLELHSVGFGRGQFQTLLPGCPVLEELMLVNMEWRDRNEILSSSSLKTLKITSEDGCLGTFSLDTPNLVYLDYGDCVAEDYPLVNLENLVEVAINLMLTVDRFYQARENVWKLIHGLRNVKILHLSPVSFEVLSLCCEAIPVFENLTLLNIKSVMSQGWQAMPLLLRNCPHLESHTLGVSYTR